MKEPLLLATKSLIFQEQKFSPWKPRLIMLCDSQHHHYSTFIPFVKPKSARSIIYLFFIKPPISSSY